MMIDILRKPSKIANYAYRWVYSATGCTLYLTYYCNPGRLSLIKSYYDDVNIIGVLIMIFLTAPSFKHIIIWYPNGIDSEQRKGEHIIIWSKIRDNHLISYSIDEPDDNPSPYEPWLPEFPEPIEPWPEDDDDEVFQ